MRTKRAGRPSSEIAAALGCSQRYVMRIRRRLGLLPPNGGSGANAQERQAERDAAAVEAYARGEKVEFIRLDYRISSPRLVQLVQAAGIPLRGAGNRSIDLQRLREMKAAGNTDADIAKEP